MASSKREKEKDKSLISEVTLNKKRVKIYTINSFQAVLKMLNYTNLNNIISLRIE